MLREEAGCIAERTRSRMMEEAEDKDMCSCLVWFWDEELSVFVNES